MIILVVFLACNCNAEGSNGNTCDKNGLCSCKANFMSDKCDVRYFGKS